MADQYDIAVIGCGIAGLTAVQHALLAGCSVAHVIGMAPMGGLVCNVGELQGYPVGAEPISGLDLAIGLLSSNSAGGAVEIPADATSISQEGDGFAIIHSDGVLQARQVIAATGASLRMLDVPGAREFEGRGVSQCAWCDGALYKEKHAVVVGAGDAALEEALHLATFASKVTILARGEQLSARRAYIDRVRSHDTIKVRTRCDVTEVVGSDRVSAVRILDHAKSAPEAVACDGVFVFIGLQPNSALIADFATLDANGAAQTNAERQTRTPGLLAIGAVRSGYGGRLVHAVSDAATAAITAARRPPG